MNIGGLFGDKKEKKDYFWSLVLEPGLVQAAIWTIVDEHAEIVSLSSQGSWKEDEELIDVCDTVLSSAVSSSGEEDIEPTKTVFGVPNNWVDGGEIKSEYLEKIKKICSELSLEPSGFVILPEAIAHLIKAEEGSPLSGVEVGVREQTIEVSLFRFGNLVGTAEVSRSVEISDDLIEGLSRFGTSEPFPSRILIYDGKEGELEEARQSLMSHDWEKEEKVKFLHTPKAEIISYERKLKATSLAGALEIAHIDKITDPDEKVEDVMDEGISSEVENVVAPSSEIKAEDLGFSLGEDVSKRPQPILPLNEMPKAAVGQAVYKEPVKKEGVLGSISQFSSRAKNSLIGVFEKKPGVQRERKSFTYLIIVGIVLLVGGIVAWWILPKAEITVYVQPQKLEKRLTVAFNTEGSPTDISGGIVAGKLTESEAQGEKTKQATGTKTVGDKAKGRVKIQNGTSSNLNLAAGTVLSSLGGLEFSTDQYASVSAAVSPSLPGESFVDVTAKNIGADHNLGKDEILKVSNYPKSEVDAVIVADFSGGSSREATAISEEDLESLYGDLEEELITKAKGDIAGNISSDEILIEESLKAEAESEDYSGSPGDEAESVKLSLKVKAYGVVVKKQEYYDFIKQSMQSQIPSGYVWRDDQVNVSYVSSESDEEKGYNYDLEISVNLLPQINVDEIAEKIKGKSETSVLKYLSTVPGFINAGVSYDPKLPWKLNTTPHLAKNIDIVLSSGR